MTPATETTPDPQALDDVTVAAVADAFRPELEAGVCRLPELVQAVAYHLKLREIAEQL